MNNNNDQSLQQAIASHVRHEYYTDRREIVMWYQQEYGASWRGKIVDDLQQLFPGAKRASLAREFQFDKRTGKERWESTKVTAKTKARYEALGKKLPPKRSIYPRSITITARGTVNPSPSGRAKSRGSGDRRGARNRVFTVNLQGTDAFDFMQNPSTEAFFEAYDTEGIMQTDVFASTLELPNGWDIQAEYS